jgi:predicted RNA binding protein YcfA (HicA-like mRNA interferase family)
MKIRQAKQLEKTLKKKGFILNPESSHHKFYYLFYKGKKYPIHTYISHGLKEYSQNLMGEIKKQLKFDTTRNAERFFDCPMTAEEYYKMLKNNGEI